MTGNEYQALAMRTNDGESTERLGYHTDPGLNEVKDFGGVLNGCLGLAGESGEVLDMVKKWVFHEKELDKDHLKKEIGDVMWYVAMLCESFGFSLDEILQMNVDKLRARYPEGFDPEKAEERYLALLEYGASPQEARAVLPNSLKTEIVVTANLREWRNIFKLRAVGVTGKPHPQMVEVMVSLLEEVKKQISVVFDDLVTE